MKFHLKRFVFLIILLVICSGLLAACNDSPRERKECEGGFFSLREAYESGWISKSDLRTIANRHNANESRSIDGKVANDVKSDMAEILRNKNPNPVKEAKAEDITIVSFLGEFNGFFAVILDHPYQYSPTVIVDYYEDIDGTKIHYTSPLKIEIYRPSVSKKGEFFSLQEAYDFGYIDLDDLKSMAYYLNEGKDMEGITPKPIEPSELDEQTRADIKETEVRYLKMQHDWDDDVSVDNITINAYFGTYNGLIAVIVDDDYYSYMNLEVVSWPKIVAGVIFNYKGSSKSIVLWKPLDMPKELCRTADA